MDQNYVMFNRLPFFITKWDHIRAEEKISLVKLYNDPLNIYVIYNFLFKMGPTSLVLYSMYIKWHKRLWNRIIKAIFLKLTPLKDNFDSFTLKHFSNGCLHRTSFYRTDDILVLKSPKCKSPLKALIVILSSTSEIDIFKQIDEWIPYTLS